MRNRKKRRGTRTAVINIREILRLTAAGFNQSQIAQSCNISGSTVQDYQRRASAAGVTHASASKLDDVQLLSLLGKDGQRRKRKEILLDFERMAKELTHKGVTLELLWKENVTEQGSDLSYSTFCRRFRSWSKSSKHTMRQDYKPGDKAFVDYAGLTIGFIDSRSGKLQQAQIFVACLGASDKIFAEATASQNVLSWIGSHCRACSYFGGVPAAFVPDNLKSAVKDPWWYEPELNRSYQDFAECYSSAVLPARVRKPRDKAKVEKAVQEVERQIIAPLRHRLFGSIEEINEAVRPLLATLNARKMRHCGASRNELFEKFERTALKPLPAQPYQIAQWKKVRVNVDYHVEFERHYYSVPYFHARQPAWIKTTEKLIEIFIDNRRVAFHQRSSDPFTHTTSPEHMPPEHAEVKSWTADKFTAWSKCVGSETEKMVRTLFETRAHPEQAFRAILGLQRLSDKYTPERLEAACRRANYFKLTQVRNIRSILDRGWDRLPLAAVVEQTSVTEHCNLRGSDIFH